MLKVWQAPAGRRWTRVLPLIAALGAGFSLSGCVGAALVAGGAAGLAVAQDRSFGDSIDDSAIDMRVQAEMLRQGGDAMNNVNVDVHDGSVLLTGTVPTPEDRVVAARSAWSTPHVKTVANELEVRNGSRFARLPKDKWISTRLRSELITKSQVKSINYGIETVDGTVYLFGKARDRAELDRVTNAARNIAGVKKVVSHVEVDGAPPLQQAAASSYAPPAASSVPDYRPQATRPPVTITQLQ